MSMSIPEIEDAGLLFIFGYNGADSHPIVARRIVNAKQKGAKIIVCDPRVTESARISDMHLQLKGGTNMALVNAIAHVIIEENLTDEKFITDHTVGYEDYRELVKKYTPEYAEKITEVPADLIRAAARAYATAETSMILYGMGVTQFSQAVDVVKTLANLALMTGNFGKLNCGIGPVRGQNNVQGACDMGALPNSYPGYQNVTDEAARKKFEQAWGVPLPSDVGLPLTRVPERVLHEKDESKKIHAYYIMGEDPVQSDPNSREVREALDAIDLVIIQDIYMNRTALHADVILPATAWGEHEGTFTCADRGFQRMRKAIEPKGDVKVDWDIICQISTAMGYPMQYRDVKEIWDEMRQLCPGFKGATYEKLDALGGVQWPCRDESMDDKGTKFLHKDGNFATASKKANFFATDWTPPKELENNEYPFTLTTGREVGHYSARTMSGNCRALRNLEDEPGWVHINTKDCEILGVAEGELIRVISRRGSVITRVLPTDRIKSGATYMTYQWWIGACNELTTSFLDPISNTPEYKYCAVRLEKIDDQKWAEQSVRDTYDKIKADMRIDPEKRCKA